MGYHGAHIIELSRFHCGYCHKPPDEVMFFRVYEPIQQIDMLGFRVTCHKQSRDGVLDANEKIIRRRKGFQPTFKRRVIFAELWIPLALWRIIVRDYTKRKNIKYFTLLMFGIFCRPEWADYLTFKDENGTNVFNVGRGPWGFPDERDRVPKSRQIASVRPKTLNTVDKPSSELAGAIFSGKRNIEYTLQQRKIYGLGITVRLGDQLTVRYEDNRETTVEATGVVEKIMPMVTIVKFKLQRKSGVVETQSAFSDEELKQILLNHTQCPNNSLYSPFKALKAQS